MPNGLLQCIYKSANTQHYNNGFNI